MRNRAFCKICIINFIMLFKNLFNRKIHWIIICSERLISAEKRIHYIVVVICKGCKQIGCFSMIANTKSIDNIKRSGKAADICKYVDAISGDSYVT